MCIGTSSCTWLAEEHICLSLVDVMTLEMVVRIVDRQVQLNDTIATRLHRCERVQIDATFPEFRSVEIERQVVLTNLLCDDLTNSRHDGDCSDIDAVVSVFGTRVVVICTALGDVIAVLPSIRRLTLADRELFGKLIGVMYEEVQTVNTVASEGRLKSETVFVCSIQAVYTDGVTCLVEVLPYIRRINIGDMNGLLIVIMRMNGEVQHVYLIAAVRVDGGVIMQTCGMNEARLESHLIHAPTHGVTLTDRRVNSIVSLLPNIDMYVVNTVVSFNRLLAVFVIAGRGDIIQTSPLERHIVLADVDCVVWDAISLVDIKGQAIDTVAT